MIKIVIMTHNELATGFTSALLLLMDNNQDVYPLCLKNDDTAESFLENLEYLIQTFEPSDEILIFADVLGGTPCNTAAKYLLNHHLTQNDTIACIANVNLPILLMAVCSREQYSLKQLLPLLMEENTSPVNVKQILGEQLVQNEYEDYD